MTAAITIHFRKAALTARCVDSLLADGWAPVLIWDNSEDCGTSLQELQARYRGCAEVEFADRVCNLGFGAGMNAALAELSARGHLGPLLLVNNDAVALPGMRDALLAEALHRTSPALLAPRIQQNGCEEGWLYYQPWFGLVTRRRLPGSVAFLSGCALLAVREDNAAPLFDEDFFMYGEDVELSWRMRRQGGSLVLLDRAWLVHDGAGSSGHASELYENLLVRSHWLLSRKLTDKAWVGGLMRMTKLPVLLARAVARSLRQGSLVPLRALLYLSGRSSRLPSDQVARR